MLEGEGDGVVVLAGSLGSTLAMWDAQAPALAARGLRVLRYDHPGHGGSREPVDPTVGAFASQVVDLLDELGIERASFVGLSLGGAVGMRLALDHPGRVDRLALLCTAARFGEPGSWRERAALVRAAGTEAIADTVVARWFSPAYRGDVRRYREMIASTPSEGYARCAEAVGGWDAREEVERIAAPTLCIAGADDPTAPPEQLAFLADRISGARLEVLAPAAHLANVERAGEVNRLLLAHLA